MWRTSTISISSSHKSKRKRAGSISCSPTLESRSTPLGTITEELFDSIFDINVKGVLLTVQKALPRLPDGASVILNASIVASKGFSSNSVYSATKAAVRSFARTWTTDLKDRRIRVNAISPGSTDTPRLNELLASSETGKERRKMISNAVPLGRLGRPDEIAKAARPRRAKEFLLYLFGRDVFRSRHVDKKFFNAF
jgi:NAD(P)-dependent dehydrogenase (short-subunit alcohol dehydrogenase family)